MTRLCKRTAMWSATLGLMLGVASCAPLITYPPRGDNALETSDPNMKPAPKVIEVALKRVISRFGIEGDYVINLPQGMERRRAESLVRRIDEARAHIVSPEHAGLPVFHVTRVWVRVGSWAEVEVLRPMAGLTAQDETMVYEPVTIRMSKSAMQPWEVDSVRAWSGREVEAPPMFGWPDVEEDATALTGAEEAVEKP